jgi:hypothetical protein
LNALRQITHEADGTGGLRETVPTRMAAPQVAFGLKVRGIADLAAISQRLLGERGLGTPIAGWKTRIRSGGCFLLPRIKASTGTGGAVFPDDFKNFAKNFWESVSARATGLGFNGNQKGTFYK